VQELLAMVNYYEEPPDGVYGPETAQAARSFQTDQGFAPDGIVRPNTYDALIRSYAVTQGLTAP
jgi:peptidoglycan hydrolase-like protein with peptidoglycan-binding domain